MTTHVAFKVLSELNRTQKGFAYIQAPKAPTDIFGAPFTATSLPPCAKRLIPLAHSLQGSLQNLIDLFAENRGFIELIN